MPAWIRCRDRGTGHEFDLSPDDIRVQDGSVDVLKDYPENSGLTAQPRAPKFRVDKAGKPTDQTPPPADNTAAGTSANTKEK